MCVFYTVFSLYLYKLIILAFVHVRAFAVLSFSIRYLLMLYLSVVRLTSTERSVKNTGQSSDAVERPLSTLKMTIRTTLSESTPVITR